MKSSSTGSSERAYLMIVGIGLAVCLVAAEVSLRVFALPLADGRAHRVHQIYRASNPDAVLGDSHLYVPFIASDRFVSLARPGSSPHALEIVAHEYYRHLDPGRVIVEASPQLFRRLMQVRSDQSHKRYFTHNFGQPFVLAIFEPGISRELASLWDPEALRNRDARLRQLRYGRLPIRESKRRKPSHEERVELTRQRITSNRPVADVRESASFQAYRRTLEALQSRGASVCMARTPVTDLYLEMSSEDPNYVEAEKALRALADELQIRFVDFVELDLFLDVASFSNPDHPMSHVAKEYATRLEAACFSPINQKPADSNPRSGSSAAPESSR